MCSCLPAVRERSQVWVSPTDGWMFTDELLVCVKHPPVAGGSQTLVPGLTPLSPLVLSWLTEDTLTQWAAPPPPSGLEQN